MRRPEADRLSSLSKEMLIGHDWTSLMALVVKNPPAMQETQEMWVRSLGREDPLEEGTAAHSSMLAWRILWTEETGRLQSRGSQSQTRLRD